MSNWNENLIFQWNHHNFFHRIFSIQLYCIQCLSSRYSWASALLHIFCYVIAILDGFRRMRSIFTICPDNGRVKSNKLTVCHLRKSIKFILHWKAKTTFWLVFMRRLDNVTYYRIIKRFNIFYCYSLLQCYNARYGVKENWNKNTSRLIVSVGTCT